MQRVEDEVPLVSADLDTNPLTQYDSERQRVLDVVEQHQRHGEDTRRADREEDDDELTVPTEYLAEDFEGTIELPASFKPGALATLVSSAPRAVLRSIFFLSAITARDPCLALSAARDLAVALSRLASTHAAVPLTPPPSPRRRSGSV